LTEKKAIALLDSFGETRPAPSGDVSQPCGEGDKAQNRSNGIVGKTCPHHQVLNSVVHQKQVIADSAGQAATVWDLGGQPAKDSGKEYSRLFKEIMGVLK
jgi:chromosome partitioning protein